MDLTIQLGLRLLRLPIHLHSRRDLSHQVHSFDEINIRSMFRPRLCRFDVYRGEMKAESSGTCNGRVDLV